MARSQSPAAARDSRGGPVHALRSLLSPSAAELPPVRVWGPWWAGVLVAAAFCAIVFGYDQLVEHTPLASVLLEAGILAALLALIVWRRRSLPPAPAPLAPSRRPHWIFVGGLTVLATAAVVGGVLHLVVPEDMHGIGHKLPSDTEGRVLAGLAMVVIAPIVEETVFRGWLMRSLTTRMKPLLAVLVSGTIFGGLHVWLARYSLGMGFELFFVGYALAYLCLWSGSMVPNVAGHMTLNFTAFFGVISRPIDTIVSVAIVLSLLVVIARWLRRRRHAHGGAAPAVAA